MKHLFAKFKSGLQRTKTLLVRNVQSLFSDVRKWDEDSYDSLEASLIGADLGVEVSMRIVDDIRDRYQRGLIHTTEDVLQVAEKTICDILTAKSEPWKLSSEKPCIILFVGVNGSGKTTTLGKLAHQWQGEGKKVMLAACDTFRAAAIEQLRIWGERTNCPVIAGKHGADAAAIAYDAATSARARGMDFLLVDTAGRQHTHRGLMNELAKIRRTLDKACPGAPHHTWLVVDGSTGTNALMQAREFAKVAPLDGICLTKLDGSSKGGVAVAIHETMQLPITFVGLGEGMDDLQPFDAGDFARALFGSESI